MSTKFEQAMLDPTNIFKSPKEVLNDTVLSKEQKIKILQQWEYDAKQLSQAEEENMLSQEGRDIFKEVKVALESLDVFPDQ